jgi:hypothetical protein
MRRKELPAGDAEGLGLQKQGLKPSVMLVGRPGDGLVRAVKDWEAVETVKAGAGQHIPR